MKKRQERWRVERGDAIGIGIRIPIDKIDLTLNLVKPPVKRSNIVPPDSYLTFYITTGNDILNDRSTTHKFLKVLCDLPPWISESVAVGNLAWIGLQNSPPNRLLWRHGFKKGSARIALEVSGDFLSAHARMTAMDIACKSKRNFQRKVNIVNRFPRTFAAWI